MREEQFIASLQGHIWPPTLQPLLLLSQDPTTRRLGEGFISLQNAFISGDTQGVLAELGRGADTRLLQPVDVRQLRSLHEELNGETPTRRNNAYRVIAELAPRFPIEQAQMLLEPLARQMSASPELRWHIGIEPIGQVIAHVSPGASQGVAAVLIDDLLKVVDGISWRLPSGQPPSLDEAVQLV